MWLCDLNVAVMKHVQVSLLYPRKEVTSLPRGQREEGCFCWWCFRLHGPLSCLLRSSLITAFIHPVIECPY